MKVFFITSGPEQSKERFFLAVYYFQMNVVGFSVMTEKVFN